MLYSKMITQEDMMRAYPHRIPHQKNEEDHLYSKYNLLENYISIPTNLNVHQKSCEESVVVSNLMMASPPVLLSQHSNEKSVIGKMGQLGRVFREKEWAERNTTLRNNENFCGPAVLVLQSRPESCRPSLNRKNLRKLIRPRPFSGINLKLNERSIVDTEVEMLEVEEETIEKFNILESLQTLESTKSTESINSPRNDNNSNDNAGYNNFSIKSLLEEVDAEDQTELATAVVVIDNKDEYADAYQPPNIAGPSTMENLSPEYTYAGVISEINKVLVRSASSDALEEEKKRGGISTKIAPLPSDNSSTSLPSAAILLNKSSESIKYTEQEIELVVLEKVQEKMPPKIFLDDDGVSLLHLLSVRVPRYETRKKELSQEALQAASEWGMGFAINDPYNVRGGEKSDTEAVYQSSDSYKNKKKFSGLGLSSLEGEGEGEGDEEGVDDIAAVIEERDKNGTIGVQKVVESTTSSQSEEKKSPSKLSPKQQRTKKVDDEISTTNLSVLSSPEKVNVDSINAPLSEASEMKALFSVQDDQVTKGEEVASMSSGSDSSINMKLVVQLFPEVEEEEKEALNATAISNVDGVSSTNPSEVLVIHSEKEDNDAPHFRVNFPRSPFRKKESSDRVNEEEDRIQVEEWKYLSTPHLPRSPLSTRTIVTKGITALTITPPVAVTDISSFPFFPVNFDKKIQSQKRLQNSKSRSREEHVVFGLSKDTSDMASLPSEASSSSSTFAHREQVLRLSSTMVARRAHKESLRMQKIEERNREDRKLAGSKGWANTVNVVCTDLQEQQQEQKRLEDEKAYHDRYNQPRVRNRSTNQELEALEIDTCEISSYEYSDNYAAVPQSAKGGNSSVGVGQLLGGSLADVDIDVGNAMYSDSLTVEKLKERARLRDEEMNRTVTLKTDVPSVRFNIKYGMISAPPSIPTHTRRSSSAPSGRRGRGRGANRIALRHVNNMNTSIVGPETVACPELV